MANEWNEFSKEHVNAKAISAFKKKLNNGIEMWFYEITAFCKPQRSKDKYTHTHTHTHTHIISSIPHLTIYLILTGNPTEIYLYGTQLATSLIGCVPGAIVVNKFILPIFYNLKLVSVNEVRFRPTSLILEEERHFLLVIFGRMSL